MFLWSIENVRLLSSETPGNGRAYSDNMVELGVFGAEIDGEAPPFPAERDEHWGKGFLLRKLKAHESVAERVGGKQLGRPLTAVRKIAVTDREHFESIPARMLVLCI
jgi:hypothetical protein